MKKGIAVKLSKAAKDYLIQNGYDALNGVRPMRRLLQDTLEDHIATCLLGGEYSAGNIIEVGTKSKELAYTVSGE